MLSSLYDAIKRFAQYVSESKIEFNFEILQTVMFRTLALLADLHIEMNNFTSAR